MAEKKIIDWIAYVLLIIGGLNWGLYGLLNMDLVALLLGTIPILATIVYLLVGISAIYVLYVLVAKK
ncbi:DUF378 domain-containing protein [Candidatus Micrarchaeota archaeon]|jgi:hypothetical protein|nr:DUF378 domain-containing protein [Candidatus Micrarchaeota archaeon]